jgi:heptose-I-phosphate ethanolaminephosphotransferase
MWMVCVFCYPFVVTSAFVLSNSATAFTAGRLAAALLYNLAFSLTVACILRLARPRLAAWLVQCLLAFLALFTFVSVMHFLLFGQLLGLPSIYALLDTTPTESSEFAFSMLQRDHLFVALALTFPLLFSLARLPRVSRLTFHRRKLALSLAVCVFGGIGYLGVLRPYLYMNNPLLLIAYTVPEAVQQKAVLQQLYAGIPEQGSVTTRVPAGQPATHVLVIGESTTSRHMALYGYGRDTTPRLNELRPELEIARDACSSRGTTMTQLKEMLTFATREDARALFTAPSLLQLMKAAGFKTFWLSNQQMVGSWDNWSAVFSKPADVRIFTDRRGGFEGASHDDKLLPLLRDALADPANHRFIVLHLMGTHHAYDLRYPNEFARFDHIGFDEGALHIGAGDPRIARYNQYDNAVLYNDYILGEIIKLVKGAGRTTLTYLSDHGEALGETSGIFGHFDGTMPRQVYDIPLIFLLSESAKSGLGEKMAVFRANLNKPFQSDSLIHTLLDLYEVGHEAWRQKRSLFNPEYSPGQRYCDTLEP